MPMYFYGTISTIYTPIIPIPSGLYLYDQLSTNAKTNLRALYSFRWCNSSYIGPIVTVRRSSDNSVSDFYADQSGVLGQGIYGTGTSISSWLTSTTGYVVKWYDQSGYGYDLSQNNTTYQPQIITTDNCGNCVWIRNNVSSENNGQLNIGKNLFSTTSVSDMHLVINIKPLAITSIFLFNFNSGTSGTTRLSAHYPFATTQYFDAGNSTNNRVTANYQPPLNIKNSFSCYKKSSTSTNGFYLTGSNASYSNTGATAATVSQFGLNISDGSYTGNSYVYGMALFSTPLNGTADETTIISWF